MPQRTAHCRGNASSASARRIASLCGRFCVESQRDDGPHPLMQHRRAGSSVAAAVSIRRSAQSQNASIMSAVPPGNSNSASSGDTPISREAACAASDASSRRTARAAAWRRWRHRVRRCAQGVSSAVLLRGRGARQFLGEAEQREVRHPHRVQNAIQVVVFVLHHAGVEAGRPRVPIGRPSQSTPR